MSGIFNATIGQTYTCSIQYFDQHGNIMNPPVPDAPPSWANTDATLETLTPAPDGSTCGVNPIAAGSDTINLNVTVGGQIFTDQLSVNIATEAQKLTSIKIVATPDAPPPAKP